jgi:glycine cleavage system aminomethyltransferase T
MKKSTFFDFLNRYTNLDFDSFLARSKEDVDYIDWNDYCLPMTYGDAASEYQAGRSTCALFDASPYTVIDGKVLLAGTCPSVAWSYGLNCWLGIASIQSEFFSNDLKYHMQIGGEQIACRPMELPFVKFDRYRQVPAPV